MRTSLGSNNTNFMNLFEIYFYCFRLFYANLVAFRPYTKLLICLVFCRKISFFFKEKYKLVKSPRQIMGCMNHFQFFSKTATNLSMDP